MGKPITAGFGASGTPPAGDQANAVIQGSISAIGPTTPFALYGAFNVAIWGEINTALTTIAATNSGTVASGTGIAVGQTVISTLVPQGATVKTKSVTTISFGGLTTAQIGGLTSASDPAAIFEHATPEATITLERSFDGGVTWITANVGGGGLPASFALGASAITGPISIVAAEPEREVAYRLNCTAYTSGTINYRISASGLAAMPWGIPVG